MDKIFIYHALNKIKPFFQQSKISSPYNHIPTTGKITAHKTHAKKTLKPTDKIVGGQRVYITLDAFIRGGNAKSTMVLLYD